MSQLQHPARRRLATVLVVAAIVAGLWWNQDRGLKAIATQTHNGLCALHDDVQRRRDTAAEYLETHPQGVVSPATGAIIITRAEIQRGIDNQTSTLRALDESGLVC